MYYKLTLLNIALCAIVCVSLSSCSGENKEEAIGDAPIEFDSNIQKRVVSKSSKQEWGNDRIGVYMVKSGETLGDATVLGANRGYITSGNGFFVPMESAQALYFPANGDKVNFVAYYPYVSDIENYTYKVDVSSQDDMSKMDLLYSNNGLVYSKRSSSVGLGFKHALTNIRFDITNIGGEALTGLKVTIKGMKTRSGFSLVDGTFTDEADSIKDIVAKTTVNGERAQSEVIVLPSNDVSGMKVVFEIAQLDRLFEWSIPDNQVYLSGNRYNYIVNFNKEDFVVVNPGGEIEDWEDNDNDTPIELDPQLPPLTEEGDGTREKPFSVEDIQDHVGENNKWVKGRLVGTSLIIRSSSAAFVPPFTVRNNVLIANSSNETNFSNCVAVELIEQSQLQTILNLADNEYLLGEEVMVKGNIVRNENGLSVVGVTDHYIDAEPKPNPEPTQYFYETCGTESFTSSTNRSSVNDFTGWDMKLPIRYSDKYGNAMMGGISASPAHVALPSKCNSQLRIQNIPAGYSDVVLSFGVMAKKVRVNAERLSIVCDGVINEQQLNLLLEEAYRFYEVSVSIPDNTTEIEINNLYEEGQLSYEFCIDNIELVGVRR